ncbi:MAG: hypothetical protein LBQ93_09065 [Treponema sp.]|nr:hypothetical protein [Treponema sp.]
MKKGCIFLVILIITLVFGMAVIGCGGGGDDETLPPEQLPVAKRWASWRDSPSTATITHSVGSDGTCTITIGGRVEVNSWEAYKVGAQYAYTAKANTNYIYTFEAWTRSGSRNQRFQYYWDEDSRLDLAQNITITNTRTTYTIIGGEIPKNGVSGLSLHCADQLGTFYVRIISITENPTRLYEPNGRWSFTVTNGGQNFTANVDIHSNGHSNGGWDFYVFDSSDNFIDFDQGTWTRNINVITLNDSNGQSFATVTLNSNTSITTTVFEPSMAGIYNGTRTW